MKHRLLALALALTGCSSTDVLVTHAYPPRPADHAIEVYLSEEAPIEVWQSVDGAIDVRELPSDAHEIGKLDVMVEGIKSFSSMLSKAKEAARGMGGDIVVLDFVGKPAHFTVTWFGGERTGRFRVYRRKA